MMDIKQAHILIEQGLQQVGVFAYSDFTHEEIDLQINKDIFGYFEKIFNPSVYNPSRPSNLYEINQETLDRTRILHEKTTLTPSFQDEEEVVFEFPEDYFHFIRASSSNSPSDLTCSILKCKDIEQGKRYKVMDGQILYKGVTYSKGDTFIGEEEKDYSPVPGIELVTVAEVVSKKFRVRTHYSEFVDKVLENSLYTTKIDSPVGEINKSNFTIHVNNFLVNSLDLVYCREPKTVSYADEIGLEFPLDVCYEIIDLVITNLSISSEQPQQKIVNQITTGNAQR